MENQYRSLVKAVSYRLIGSMATVVIVGLATDNFALASAIGGLDFFAKIFLYYLHERLWQGISWGAADQVPFSETPPREMALIRVPEESRLP